MSARRAAPVALTAACLVTAAGCAGSPSAEHVPAPRHVASVPTTGIPAPTAGHRLAAAYLAIALPANRKLERAEDGYADHCRTNLPIAEASLRTQAVIEQRFDDQLAAIRFPPGVAVTAGALISVNQIRVAFTLRQARAGSIRALLAFTAGHLAADAEVEAQVRVIRAKLGLPPPGAS